MKDTLLIKNIRFDGNNLCLDFINTIHNRYVEEPSDYIINKITWLEWLQRKELLKTGSLLNDSHLFDLQQIRQLRELLYRLFYGIINDKALFKKDISEFNRYLLKLRKATKFSIENGIPTEEICVNKKDLNSYLLLIVKQAHQLFFFKEINHIKECRKCGWLFLDTSKSNKRKWCNMKTCGNEAKAKRHYQRIKDKKSNHEQPKYT